MTADFDWVPPRITAAEYERIVADAEEECLIYDRVRRGTALAAELNHRHRIESDATEKE